MGTRFDDNLRETMEVLGPPTAPETPKKPPRPAPTEDPAAPLARALSTSNSGNHYRRIVLAEIPEDSIDPTTDAPRLARLIYVGSLLSLWQLISSFSTSRDFREQEKIAKLALAYVRHVETLRLEPLQLTEEEARGPLGQQAAVLRARLVEVVREAQLALGGAPSLTDAVTAEATGEAKYTPPHAEEDHVPPSEM